MYKNIFSINSTMMKGLRGRSAQVTINKELLKTNPDAAITEVSRKYEQFLKMNGLTKLPIYQYPKQANRLMERQRPHEERNLIRKESLRKRDRAVIKGFCDFFMFSQRRYKPHKD